MENVVYMELLTRGYTVYIGRQGAAEVDFIAEKNKGSKTSRAVK